jgi:ketosteroid isomerase-like protein
MRYRLCALVVPLACMALLATSAVTAAPTDEIRATFLDFVAAQNAHDLEAVGALLSDSPNFLWATRDGMVRGRDDALQRFARLFQGTWRVDPDRSTLEVFMLDVSTAQVIVTVVIADGARGQPTPPDPMLMNQIMVDTPGGWRVLSILPVSMPRPCPLCGDPGLPARPNRRLEPIAIEKIDQFEPRQTQPDG